MIEAVVRVAGLVKTYPGHVGFGWRKALRSIDLDVRRGEIFGLLGPRDAGKTTTLKILVGLLRGDRGEVRLFDGSPRDARVRARIGYLAENPSFHDHLRATALLELHAKLQGISARDRRDVVARTLRRVGLAGHERTRLRKFTTGMRRRIGLARAIQHEPELLILDEPMADLDPAGRREVRDLLLAQREAGCTVLFSGRVAEDVEALCDRVAYVERGSVSSIGPLDSASSEAEWFEIALETDVPEMLPGELICRSGRRCLLRVEERRALRSLLLAAHERGDDVLSVWPGRSALESRGAGVGSENA